MPLIAGGPQYPANKPPLKNITLMTKQIQDWIAGLTWPDTPFHCSRSQSHCVPPELSDRHHDLKICHWHWQDLDQQSHDKILPKSPNGFENSLPRFCWTGSSSPANAGLDLDVKRIRIVNDCSINFVVDAAVKGLMILSGWHVSDNCLYAVITALNVLLIAGWLWKIISWFNHSLFIIITGVGHCIAPNDLQLWSHGYVLTIVSYCYAITFFLCIFNVFCIIFPSKIEVKFMIQLQLKHPRNHG